MKKVLISMIIAAAFVGLALTVAATETVKIGLNYPQTGPYAAMGLDEFQAATSRRRRDQRRRRHHGQEG